MPRRPGKRLRPLLLLLAFAGGGGAFIPPAQAVDTARPAPVLATSSLATRYFGPDAPWYERNIPFFDCSDPDLTRIYYYRWQVYRSHLRDLGPRGYIVTEFLDDVGWALKPWQSLNDATAFHLLEGRWLRNRRYIDDYIDFMYSGGNDRHFSEAIAAATYDCYLANGDRAFAIRNLPAMIRIYHEWADHFVPAKGLYFIEPLLDATEYSIASIDASGGKDGFTGGDAFRPTINSFMFANARAIGRLAALAGDATTAGAFSNQAGVLRRTVERELWNSREQQFMDRYKVSNRYVHYWDFIRGRELAGYVPWAFELPDQNPKYNASWRHLLSSTGFAGPFGLRTVEPTYQYYLRQYRYATVDGQRRPECQWNGPSWPFDTTLVLEGMANLLNDYHQDIVHSDDYVRLLRQYARQHLQNGEPDLQEDYNPDTGRVIVGLPRSHHYNHSGFDDLIITGLVGLRPRADNVLEINPLIPASGRSPEAIRYFCLQDVPYHGHAVTVLYDRTGEHYHRGAGLSVYLDGRRALAPSPLGRKLIAIPGPVVRPVAHPVDLAVNLTGKGYPAASASAGTAASGVDQAVDGRIWFFPNVRNYWSSAGSTAGRPWFAVDFGPERRIGSVQLSFFADGTTFQAPTTYVIQSWTGTSWRDVPNAHATPAQPVANGENTVTFPAVTTSRLRVRFSTPTSAAVALVEFKAFE